MLGLQVLQEELSENAELESGVFLKNFKDQERRKNVLLSNLIEGRLQLIFRVWLISEVGEGPDPEVTISTLIVWLHDELFALAHFKHLLVVLLRDVEIEELLLQIITLTAVLDALL